MREQSQIAKFFQEMLTDLFGSLTRKDETWTAVATRAGLSTTQLSVLRDGKHNPGEEIEKKALRGLGPEIDAYVKRHKNWAEYITLKRREHKITPPGGRLRVAE